MGDKTGIEWTDATWNPVSGCSKVSQGCKNCYAERVFPRAYPGRAFTDVRVHPDRLEQPLHWRKPRRVFVDSMGDMFHEAVPVEILDRAFAVMAIARWHTFQILTKRPARMRDYMHELYAGRMYEIAEKALPPGWEEFRSDVMLSFVNGLRNVWLGVSVEDQATADERIPLLLQTPAAVRFLSCEPLLEPVNITDQPWWDWRYTYSYFKTAFPDAGPPIDWIIVGGESGPGARPFSIDAARDIVAQCRAAGVPVFVKQIGRYPYSERERWSIRGGGVAVAVDAPDQWSFRDNYPKDRKGGDPAEWPEDLRVREFPR